MQEAQQLLNFRVRDGLVVHRRRRITRSGANGRSFSEFQISSHGKTFGNTAIALEPDEVRAYAHALEPTDEASAAALQALHFRPRIEEPSLSYEQKIVNRTIQSLVAAGLLKAAPQ